MVKPHARRGGSTFGCLFTVALLAAGLYVFLLFARPWFRNAQFEEEMRNVGKFASTTPDSLIRVRLRARADSLGLPRNAKRLTIKRTAPDGIITISSKYEVTVTVPLLGPKVLTFEPKAVEQL